MKNILLISVLTLIVCQEVLSQERTLFTAAKKVLINLVADHDSLKTDFRINTEQNKFDAFQIEKVYIEDSDLLLQYSLQNPEKGLYYSLDFNIVDLQKADTFDLPAYAIDFNPGPIKTGQTNQQIFRWKNALENGLEYQGEYMITLLAMLKGDVNCDDPPRFDLNQQLPYYTTVTVGVALIGIGAGLKSQADKDYEEYDAIWAAGRLETEAQPVYNNGSDKNRNSKYLIIGGGVIILADAILFTLRKMKHKRKMEQYKKYCSEKGASLSILPEIRIPGNAGGNTQFGFRLDFQF